MTALDHTLHQVLPFRTCQPQTKQNAKTKYIHQSLAAATNFRILHLHPGKFEEDIWFSLTEHAITDNVTFHALSYAWNSVELSHQIYSSTGYLNITENLVQALRRYRQLNESVWLWVDAVCISQDDWDEKAQQVQLMGKIFSQSSRTFVWLGEESATDQKTFEYITSTTYLWWQRLNTETNGASQWEITLEIVSDITKHHAQGVSALLERNWFLRAWTYQEILCARQATVSCGLLEMDYEHLFNLGTTWYKLGLMDLLTSEIALEAMAQIVTCAIQRDNYRNHSADLSFTEMVQSIRARKSTDPRDRIYSLVGIAFQPEPLPYPPKYSVEVSQLYRDFAIHTIRQSNNLEIFEFCHFERKDFSTWVPDWRTVCPETRRNRLFRACGDHQLRIVPSENTKELTVEGIVLDKILCLSENVLDTKFVPNITFDLFKIIAKFMKEYDFIQETLTLASQSLRYSDENERYEAWWRTLIGDRISDLQRATQGYEKDFQKYMTALTLQWFKNGAESLKDEDLEKSQAVRKSIMRQAAFRRFCLTKDGRIGWVCNNARKGDLVTVLFGSATPVLLRPKDDCFLMLEQCYIHGIMDGEAMTEENLSRLRQFCLI